MSPLLGNLVAHWAVHLKALCHNCICAADDRLLLWLSVYSPYDVHAVNIAFKALKPYCTAMAESLSTDDISSAGPV